MTREEKKQIRSNGKLAGFTLILFLLSSIFLIYNIFLLGPIEPLIRYIIIGIIIIIDLLKIKKRKMVISKNKKAKRFNVFNVIFSILFVLIGVFIYNVYDTVSAFTSSMDTYSSSLVVKSDSSINKLSDVKNTTLGMISDTNSYDGYILPNEIIDKNDLESNNKVNTYDDYSSLIDALYKDDVDGIFVPSSYTSMFSNNGYENIEKDTKVIYSSKKLVRRKVNGSKRITKPITILLMGIDSNVNGINNGSSNSDTLMLVTFNPDTLTTTMLSIPRDSYVPVTCMNNSKTKITHAGWQGETCVENTIENFLDIDIDYYVKINFKGVVDLVDALGGIDVEVPQDLCTDSSDRVGEVCIKKGNQHLDGEGALVLARNRKQLARGDIDRGLNQQIVIKGILNAVSKNITNIGTLNRLLDSLSSNMDTNFTTSQILSFYNVGKDILRKSNRSATDSLNIIQLYLQGKGASIYDSKTGLDLYYYILYKQSVDKVSEAMNVNLGKMNPTLDKKATWSIDENYVHVPLGQNIDDFTTLYYSGSYSRPVENSSESKTTTNNQKEEIEEETDEEDEEDTSDDKEEDEEDEALNTVMP